MPFACPGRCNTDTNITTWGDPVWCGPCAQLARTALRSLPQAYTALGTVALLTASQPLDAVRVSGTRERPSTAPGADLQDEIFHTLRSWEDTLRQHQRHRAARDATTRETTVTLSVRYLNRNFDTAIARQPGGEEFGQNINVLFSTALRMVKNGPLRHILSVPCPRCGRKALMQQEGLALQPWYTACETRLGGCGCLYSEQEMSWLVEVRMAVAR